VTLHLQLLLVVAFLSNASSWEEFIMTSKLAGEDRPGPGNLSILTKVDKLRELIGTRVALPQVCLAKSPK
jgi:hypothetical protein